MEAEARELIPSVGPDTWGLRAERGVSSDPSVHAPGQSTRATPVGKSVGVCLPLRRLGEKKTTHEKSEP